MVLDIEGSFFPGDDLYEEESERCVEDDLEQRVDSYEDSAVFVVASC